MRHTQEERDGVTLRIVAALAVPAAFVLGSLLLTALAGTALGLEYSEAYRLREVMAAVVLVLGLAWAFWRVRR